LSAINNARQRSYRVADKKGFHNREDVNYDIPKQPKRSNFRDRFRYTALEEVKMEQGNQRSLIEPMIDRTKPPHKFHVVTKIQSTYGETYYVKEALAKLGFIISGRKVNIICLSYLMTHCTFSILAMGCINSDR
jgi:hypothetical protein